MRWEYLRRELTTGCLQITSYQKLLNHVFVLCPAVGPIVGYLLPRGIALNKVCAQKVIAETLAVPIARKLLPDNLRGERDTCEACEWLTVFTWYDIFALAMASNFETQMAAFCVPVNDEEIERSTAQQVVVSNMYQISCGIKPFWCCNQLAYTVSTDQQELHECCTFTLALSVLDQFRP